MEQQQMNALSKVAEVKLVYQSNIHPDNRIKVDCSEAAYNIFKASWDINRIELVEQVKMLMLDQGNRCLGLSEISSGGMAGCMLDRKIIFGTALKAKASGLIFGHNHPSGNSKPSEQDITMTKFLMEAGKILDIKVEDHLILTAFGYCSMRDGGVYPVMYQLACLIHARFFGHYLLLMQILSMSVS